MSRTKFRFAIEHLWGLVVILGIFVFVNTHPIRPYDFWWHITIGREILTTGQIPTKDIYSYTEAGQPYPSYQMFWLMETALYGIYKLGGPALIVLLQSLMVTSAYMVILWICKQVSNSWRIAAVGALIAAALGMNDWNVRPQAITFLLASLFLLAIYNYRSSPRWGWLVVFPLCMLVWVNSHGTFILGLVLIAIWWAHEGWQTVIQRAKHLDYIEKKPLIVPGIVLGITLLVCLINPRGFGIIDYVKTLTSNNVVQNLVTEWAPPSIHSWMGIIFFFVLSASALLLIFSPKRPDFFQIATYLAFGLLSVRTSRGIVWFGLVMAPIIASHITAVVKKLAPTDQKPANQHGSRLINLAIAGLLLLMALLSLPWFKSALPLPPAKAGLISSETPVDATRFLLQENLPGRVFNAMSFGSYLIWAAYPHYQVFVDSRIELFPENIWMDYFKISTANDDWQALLEEYGVATLMLSVEDQPDLILAVRASGKWTEIYKDALSCVFTRTTGLPYLIKRINIQNGFQ